MQLEVARAVTDDIICEVESLLRDGLSVVVEQEMKAVYEHMWYASVRGEACMSIRSISLTINVLVPIARCTLQSCAYSIAVLEVWVRLRM